MKNLPLPINSEVYKRLNDIKDLRHDAGEAVKESKRAAFLADEARQHGEVTRKQVKAALDEGDQLVEVQMLRVDPETDKTYDYASLRVDAAFNRTTKDLDQRGLNAQRYGAKGDGSDDTQVFKHLFDKIKDLGAGTIYVPAGEYIISETIRVYKGTTVEMDERAVIRYAGPPSRCLFLNGEYGNKNYAKGYDGDGDIFFRGGVIDMGDMPAGATGYGPIAFGISHATNVHWQNVSMRGGYNNHYVDLNAVRHSSFVGCQFENMKITGTNFYEAIQIDMSSDNGFPHFGVSDNVPSTDCIVDRCTFRNVQIGVGSHASRIINGVQVMYDSVRITNNVFINMVLDGIRGDSFFGAHIEGNFIDSTGQHGIYLLGGAQNYIGANYVSNTAEHGICLVSKGINGVEYWPEDTIVQSARVSHTGRSGVRIVRGRRINIVNVQVEDTTEDGMSATGSEEIRYINPHIRGASQGEHGYYNAIRLSSVNGGIISGANISNQGFGIKYKAGISIPGSNSRIHTPNNQIEPGASGLRIQATINANNSSIDGEVYLTNIRNERNKGAIIDLNDDINNYSYLIFGTGIVHQNTMMHGMARKFYAERGWRPGEDLIIVPTVSGQPLKMEIVNNKRLKILEAPQPFRYVIGVKG